MYEVVPYAPELRPQVAALQRHLWRGDVVRNTAYLAWKYEQNPYLPAPLMYLALYQGKVVGMRGAFGSCWEAGQDRFVVPCADDFVIAPAHRQHGLFGRIMSATLADLAARGHQVAFNLSGGPATLAGSLASGWKSVGSVQEVCRGAASPSWPRRLGSHLSSRLLTRGWDVTCARPSWRPFQRLDRVAPATSAGGAVWCAREPRPQAMADLVAQQAYDGRIRHVRNARYLAWRFQNPLHEYRFLLAGEDRLDGYLVLQVYRLFPHRGVNIVDWEARNHTVRRALLDAAIAWGGFGQLSTWTMSLPDETRALLRAAGFAPAVRDRLVRQGPAVLVRAVGTPTDGGRPMLGAQPLLDAGAWDMRMLYSMAG
jgi:GNAT superfamily N-acetyltransferase